LNQTHFDLPTYGVFKGVVVDDYKITCLALA
jgi:hypothetical protein